MFESRTDALDVVSHRVTHWVVTHDDAKHQPPAPEQPSHVDKESSPAQASRKERVLHTRVPAVLEQELRRLATSFRVPMSNVVRAILEDAVTAVDKVGQIAEQDLNRVLGRLAQHRQKLKTIAHAKEVEPGAGPNDNGQSAPQPASHATNAGEGRDARVGIVGYQPIILAADSRCAHCNRPLQRGEEVFLGLRDGAGPRLMVGRECLPELEQPKHPTGESS